MPTPLNARGCSEAVVEAAEEAETVIRLPGETLICGARFAGADAEEA